MEEPVVPLKRNVYGHPAGLLWERKVQEILSKQRISHLFSFVSVDDIKIVGRNKHLRPVLDKSGIFGLYLEQKLITTLYKQKQTNSSELLCLHVIDMQSRDNVICSAATISCPTSSDFVLRFLFCSPPV